MDNELIKLLLAPRAAKARAAQPTAIVRGSEGLERASVDSLAKGQFVGKQGTPRRSRKGATRIAANGRRYYEVAWDSPVVAYKAEAVVK
jgi:hypothetical protein